METLETTPTATKTTWNLDLIHSNLDFSIKHLMVSNVRGSFKDFSVNVITDDNEFTSAKIEAKIETGSIHTGQEQREGHLKSADFFDVEKYPDATFKSKSIEKTGNEGEYKVNGNLTVKGVTKPITLDVEYNGAATDPYGNKKSGFDFKTVINRSDFGINFNSPLDSGGVMLGNDVKISGGLELTKQKEA